MTRATAMRINRAIDAAVRVTMRVSESVLFLAWVFVLVLLTQALPYVPGLGS